MIDLSVIIVNYKVKHYLLQCIDSVIKASNGLNVEIIVVDNNSRDGSIDYLCAFYPDVIFIENHINIGFAKANNQGLNQSRGRYVLLLNPDTVLSETTLSDCLRFMDGNDDAGALGVKMLKCNGTFAFESRRGIPTPFVAFCKMSGLNTIFPKNRIFGRYYMRYLDVNSVEKIEVVSGAFMFIRRCALDKSGFLDEDFFMYGEDIDLSYRLLKTGMHNYYIPNSILHYKGESTQKNTYRYVYNFYNAMLVFMRKHFSDYQFFVTFPIKTAIYVKASMEYLGKRLRRCMSNKRMENLDFMRQFKYLFIGVQVNIAKVEIIMNKVGLKMKTIRIDERLMKYGHTSVDNYWQYDYIVYDVSLFSYSTIFCFFECAKIHSPKMAFFHPDKNMIVTDNYVFL